MDAKKVLVTGANGFLGRTILSRLVSSGISVCATDMATESITPRITYQQADITNNPETLNPVMENVETVIHAAGLAHVFSPDANTDEKFHQVNEIGTANVTTAAARAGVRHMILISSVSVYGPYTNGVYDENIPCKPLGPYAVSKYRAELQAIRISRKAGISLAILRLATLYGEGDPGNVGRLIDALARGRFIWIGDGSNRKSLLHKADAARACQAVVTEPAPGIHTYNVSAQPCTMRDIVNAISNGLGKKPLPVHIPGTLASQAANVMSKLPYRHGVRLQQTVEKWLAEDVYDPSLFEKTYAFQAETALEDGLKSEVNWFRHKDAFDKVPDLQDKTNFAWSS